MLCIYRTAKKMSLDKIITPSVYKSREIEGKQFHFEMNEWRASLENVKRETRSSTDFSFRNHEPRIVRFGTKGDEITTCGINLLLKRIVSAFLLKLAKDSTALEIQGQFSDYRHRFLPF